MLEFTDIIVAVIASLGSFSATVLSQSKQTAILQTKLDSTREDVAKLSAHVEQHNNLGIRLAVVENQIDEIKKELKK